MRRILIDRARDKKRTKRGGERRKVDLDTIEIALDTPADELLDLDEATRSGVADHDPVRELAGCSTVSVGAGVELDQGVELAGRCSLALATRIGKNARLVDTVVLEESWIGPGCRLERVIVGPNTELPAGFEAKDAIICPDLAPDRGPDEGVDRHGSLLIRSFAA